MNLLWLVAVLPFLSTLLGGVAVFRLQHRLHVVMAFAAGILVATGLADLMPESVELVGTSGPLLTGAAAVVGYLVYTAVEAFIHESSYEHGHQDDQDPATAHEHDAPSEGGASALGWVAPAGLIAHSTLDGVAIGLGFAAGGEVGVIVTLAVLVHDFADGINIVTLAFAAGHGRRSAIVLLALDALATLVGIGISQVIAVSDLNLGVLLGAFGGAFIAIGAGHLLPEAEHRNRAGASPLVLLTVLGALLVLAARLAIG